MKLQSHFRFGARRHGEQGYILLTLLLMIAMMAIVLMATVALPKLQFSMRRNQEEEMIHRGVQYSNAIRRFYKKFGRYPTKIEDLENSNNIKFLRKRYKDPMNCKAGKCEDFKILYFSDVQTTLSGFGGGSIPGASPIGGNAGAAGSLGASSSAFGQSSFGQSSAFGGSSSFGNSSSSFGQSSSSFGQSSFGQSSSGSSSGQSSNTPAQPGTDSSQSGTGNGTDNSDNTNGTAGTNGSPGSNQLGASGQVIGGPIVGVASATKSTENTIREFNHKKKYKDWMFVYDPMQDPGRLITTPYQPQMQGMGQAPNVNGQNGQPNNNNGAFGSSPFGNSSSGFSNTPSPSSGGFGSSNSNSNPSSSPQQQ